MTDKTDLKAIKEDLGKQIDKWQTKIDEAKVQMHLGVQEVEDKLKPHVEQLEQELGKAKVKMDELEQSSEGAWGEIKEGIESSVDVMKMAFESAQEHFTKKK
ncbi:MAG: putative nucleic acid-binding Zn-ribbon protein [Desulforhopalus sp.]|jgi:predicted  nucleic acid-binding Zn-ribbon protein